MLENAEVLEILPSPSSTLDTFGSVGKVKDLTSFLDSILG
jgi:hypothetical protein